MRGRDAEQESKTTVKPRDRSNKKATSITNPSKPNVSKLIKVAVVIAPKRPKTAPSSFLFTRTSVLREAYSDPEYAKRLAEAKSVHERAQILAEFCRKRNYSVGVLKVKGQ